MATALTLLVVCSALAAYLGFLAGRATTKREVYLPPEWVMRQRRGAS